MNLLEKLGDRLGSLLGVSRAQDDAPPSVRPTLSAHEARALAASVRKDWLSLVKRLFDAALPLVPLAKDEDSVEAMALRIAGRALGIGAQGLAWSRQEATLAKLKNGKRAPLFAALDLASCDPQKLPPDLERAATAFLAPSEVTVIDGQRVRAEARGIDDEQRDRATIAAFYTYIRIVSDMLEELALAAQTSAHVAPVNTAMASALRLIGTKQVTPKVGEPPDLKEASVAGYAPAEASGLVLTIRKAGLSYRSEVLRKAEVIVSKAQDPVSEPEG